FHAEKMSASGAGLGNHIDRKEGHEHTFQNADAERRHLNQAFAVTGHCQKPLHTAITDRIAEGYTGTTAIRKDAVRALSLVFTGTHEDMKAIEADPEKMKGWLKANYNFVVQEFGKENVVRLVLHLDEKTPHLHAVVVPLREGKLTAKTILGNKKDMSQRQDRYAQAMAPFGLSRGVRGSKAIHNAEGWYLGQQQQAQEAVLSDLPRLTALDRLNPAQYEKSVQERFKSATKEKTDAAIELRRREQQLQAQERQISKLQQELKEVKSRLSILQETVTMFVKSLLGRPVSEEEKKVMDIYANSYRKAEERKLSEKQEEQQRPKKGRGMGL
ncbi:plasmid recombination enzyme, partial [Pontibacter ummariensis]